MDSTLFGLPPGKAGRLGAGRGAVDPFFAAPPPPRPPQTKDDQDAEFQELFAAMEGRGGGRGGSAASSYAALGLSPPESIGSARDGDGEESGEGGFSPSAYLQPARQPAAALGAPSFAPAGSASFTASAASPNPASPLAASMLHRYTAGGASDAAPAAGAGAGGRSGSSGARAASAPALSTPSPAAGSVVSALSAVELSRVDEEFGPRSSASGSQRPRLQHTSRGVGGGRRRRRRRRRMAALVAAGTGAGLRCRSLA